MDRFKIALKKNPPRSKPVCVNKQTGKKVYKNGLNQLSLSDGPITIIDSNGNRIEGFVRDYNVEQNRPVHTITSFNGPIDMIPERSETIINFSFIVDQTVATTRGIA
jgi:hypothetical protein